VINAIKRLLFDKHLDWQVKVKKRMLKSKENIKNAADTTSVNCIDLIKLKG
jgi:hypothetical protein